MSKHTPGPWKAVPGTTTGAKVITIAAVAKAKITIAHVGGPDREANSQAIAAVPEMLAALQDVPLPSAMGTAAEHYRRFYDWHKNVVEPALAKAEA